MTEDADLLLVSASPRRRELLAMIGVRFAVLEAGIDESRLRGEEPGPYAARLAREKALAGYRRAGAGKPALGADTIVLLEGEVLGKPVGPEDAKRMLRNLSDREHQVLSAVALAIERDRVVEDLNRTRVTFGKIPDAWIDDYCGSAEPMDKAGAYAIQGFAGQWVRHIEGSYSGVMGLPLFETAALLRGAGVPMRVPDP